jgi:hypothetical protein
MSMLVSIVVGAMTLGAGVAWSADQGALEVETKAHVVGSETPLDAQLSSHSADLPAPPEPPARTGRGGTALEWTLVALVTALAVALVAGLRRELRRPARVTRV